MNSLLPDLGFEIFSGIFWKKVLLRENCREKYTSFRDFMFHIWKEMKLVKYFLTYLILTLNKTCS